MKRVLILNGEGAALEKTLQSEVFLNISGTL